MEVGTVRQLAAVVVESSDSFPGASFVISGRVSGPIGGRWCLSVVSGERQLWLASTRNPVVARDFATLEAAVRACQDVAAAGMCERDHGWTGEADRLRCMPQVRVSIAAPL